MKQSLFITILSLACWVFCAVSANAQEKPDSLSIKPDTIQDISTIVSFPSSEFLILPKISASPFSKFNMVQFMDMKAIIARNVYMHRDRYHFVKDGNRYFMSWLMPGLILEPDLGPNPEFNYNVFLEKNFDKRVYKIPTIQSTYQNKQIFKNGTNPTDKINW